MSMIKLKADRLILSVSSEIKQEIHKLIQCDGFERAGCIMGKIYPNSNRLEITHILEADYKTQNTHFVETNELKLNENVLRIWKESNGHITYIGDWHTHPEDHPTPSSLDIETSYKKFNDGSFSQNILIDMIIGRKSNHTKAFNGSSFYDVEVAND